MRSPCGNGRKRLRSSPAISRSRRRLRGAISQRSQSGGLGTASRQTHRPVLGTMARSVCGALPPVSQRLLGNFAIARFSRRCRIDAIRATTGRTGAIALGTSRSPRHRYRPRHRSPRRASQPLLPRRLVQNLDIEHVATQRHLFRPQLVFEPQVFRQGMPRQGERSRIITQPHLCRTRCGGIAAQPIPTDPVHSPLPQVAIAEQAFPLHRHNDARWRNFEPQQARGRRGRNGCPFNRPPFGGDAADVGFAQKQVKSPRFPLVQAGRCF